jgi:hypothetical protein
VAPRKWRARLEQSASVAKPLPIREAAPSLATEVVKAANPSRRNVKNGLKCKNDFYGIVSPSTGL